MFSVCFIVAYDPGNPLGVEGIAQYDQGELVFLETWGRRDVHGECLFHNNILCTLWNNVRLDLEIVIALAGYPMHAILVLAAVVLGLELLLADIACRPKCTW